MTLTDALRTKLVRKPLKRVTDRTARTISKLGELAEKGKAIRAVRGALSRNEGVAASARARFQDLKAELEKVISSTPAKGSKPARSTATPRRSMQRKMPEQIRVKSGGKRLPGTVAKTAVRKGSGGFKAKKGQKQRHH